MLDKFAKEIYSTLFDCLITGCTIGYDGKDQDFNRYDGLINNDIFEIKLRLDINDSDHTSCMGEEGKRLAIIKTANTISLTSNTYCNAYIIFLLNDGTGYLFDASKKLRTKPSMVWVPKDETKKEYEYKLMCFYDKRDGIKFKLENYNLFMCEYLKAKSRYTHTNDKSRKE
jgi:hypothetical protein